MKQISVFLFALSLFSCADPYKKIVTDTKRTEEERALLEQACIVEFTPKEVYIEGEQVVVHDTTIQVVEVAAEPQPTFSNCPPEVVDSILRFTKRNAPVKIKLIRETVLRVDTIDRPDTRQASLWERKYAQETAAHYVTKAKLESTTGDKNALQKSKNKWLWWLIGSGALNLLLAYTTVRRIV